MTPADKVEIVDEQMAAVLRQKTPAERLKIAFNLWEFTRSTLRRQLAATHPDWTHEEVCREAARRMLHDT
jgi:hypothetical protein